jgi:hypothetical protein
VTATPPRADPGRSTTQASPARPPTGGKTQCCGDPANLDGDAHPWKLITDDGPGDVYGCPECGAIDVD